MRPSGVTFAYVVQGPALHSQYLREEDEGMEEEKRKKKGKRNEGIKEEWMKAKEERKGDRGGGR